jgi:arsenite methyltransferase
MSTISPDALKACCAGAYGSDLAQAVLGHSFHPGGVRLTRRLAHMVDLRQGEHVLDVASGPGTTAVLLATEFGATVHGVDLSPALVERATELAAVGGLGGRVIFELGDAERLPQGAAADVLVCECALCTFPDQTAALGGFAGAIRDGGRVAISDVVIDRDRLPDELAGVVGAIACVASARSIEGYVGLMQDAGLRVIDIERHDDAVVEMIERIDARLAFLAMAGGGTIAGLDPAPAREIARVALEAARDGVIGYALMTAERFRTPAVGSVAPA